jgi:ubiquinone/menaquinone biosynthesis C-methylase UbiE
LSYPTINSKVQDESTLLSLYSLFRSKPDSFWFWCLSEGFRYEPWLDALLPGFPSKNIQELFTGRSGLSSMEQAFGFYQVCKQQLSQTRLSISPDSQILDFGCGWGRISRFFLKDVHPLNLYAVDSMPKAIRLCRNLNLTCQTAHISPFAPVFFKSNSFDYIFAYSVFSHLSEKCASDWIREFQRILKPGGVVMATVRPREVVLEFEYMRNSPQHSQVNPISLASFRDVTNVLKAYDEGQYIFDSGTPTQDEHTFFGETLIPEAYVQKYYSQILPLVRFVPFEEHFRFDQNLLFLQKRPNPASDSKKGSDDLNSQSARDAVLPNQSPHAATLDRIYAKWERAQQPNSSAEEGLQTNSEVKQPYENHTINSSLSEQYYASFQKRLNATEQNIIAIRHIFEHRNPKARNQTRFVLKKLTRIIAILDYYSHWCKTPLAQPVIRYLSRTLLSFWENRTISK